MKILFSLGHDVFRELLRLLNDESPEVRRDVLCRKNLNGNTCYHEIVREERENMEKVLKKELKEEDLVFLAKIKNKKGKTVGDLKEDKVKMLEEEKSAKEEKKVRNIEKGKERMEAKQRMIVENEANQIKEKAKIEKEKLKQEENATKSSVQSIAITLIIIGIILFGMYFVLSEREKRKRDNYLD